MIYTAPPRKDMTEVSIWRQFVQEHQSLQIVRKEVENCWSQLVVRHTEFSYTNSQAVVWSKLCPLYGKTLDRLQDQLKRVQELEEKLEVLLALSETPEVDVSVIEPKRKKRTATEALDSPLVASTATVSPLPKKDQTTNTPGLSRAATTTESPKMNIEQFPVAKKQKIAIKPGTMVAAKVTNPVEKTQEWIQALVKQYQPERQRYVVEDSEPDDHGIRAKYQVSARYVLTLPGKKTDCNFASDQIVLALYPNTTCFYRAIVKLPPAKNPTHPECYQVAFDDDNDQLQQVSWQWVLSHPSYPAAP